MDAKPDFKGKPDSKGTGTDNKFKKMDNSKGYQSASMNAKPTFAKPNSFNVKPSSSSR